MASTTFSQGVTIASSWLNDVNTVTYTTTPANTANIATINGSGGANFVGYTQGGTGAITRTVQTKLRETVSVKDFGAVGDGVTDDTAAFASAFAAISSLGGTVLIPSGSYSVGSVNVTGKPVTFMGYNATIVCTSATGVFYKTDHDNKLSVFGVKFTGSGTARAINCQQSASTTVYDELLIADCSFNMGSGVYGIYCVGTREPRIERCTFQNTSSGCGIYFKDCVSPFLFQCIFKGTTYTGRAVYYPGTGNGTDAGLILRDSEIMGWDKGVEIVGCDWLCVEGCTIDYNNQSFKIAAQDGAFISGNYLGSLGATAALWITYDSSAVSPSYCDKIIVEGNTFTGHYTGGNTYDNVLIDGSTSSDSIQFRNNAFTFYTRYGLNVTMTNTRLSVTGNSFVQRPTFGVSPFYSTLGASDSGFAIKDNYFTNGATISGMNLSAICKLVQDNIGCGLKASGQVIIGVGASTSTFAHGITGYTPSALDVYLTPTNQPAATAVPYVSAIDATNCTINTVNNVATSAAGINYQISRYKA